MLLDSAIGGRIPAPRRFAAGKTWGTQSPALLLCASRIFASLPCGLNLDNAPGDQLPPVGLLPSPAPRALDRLVGPRVAAPPVPYMDCLLFAGPCLAPRLRRLRATPVCRSTAVAPFAFPAQYGLQSSGVRVAGPTAPVAGSSVPPRPTALFLRSPRVRVDGPQL